MKNAARLLMILVMVAGFILPTDFKRANGQTPFAGEARIMPTLFPTEDVVVASFNVAEPPYAADLTGERDVTATI